MDAVRYRELRGLVIAWRIRPQWLREPPTIHKYTVGGNQTMLPGMRSGGRTIRYSNYRRIQLPTFGQLRGKEALRNHRGRCRWCKLPIAESNRTLWHETCLPAYWAATGQQSALTAHLMTKFRQQNEGMEPPCDQCNRCGSIQFNYVTDRYPNHETYLFYHRFGTEWKVEPNTKSDGAHQMELDHREALSVAWASGDERRLIRALTIENLRWMCHDCHAAKTAADRRRMNNLMRGRPEEWTAPPKKTKREPPQQMALPATREKQ